MVKIIKLSSSNEQFTLLLLLLTVMLLFMIYNNKSKYVFKKTKRVRFNLKNNEIHTLHIDDNLLNNKNKNKRSNKENITNINLNVNNNERHHSYWGHMQDKAYERVINPLLPPERSYENTYGISINVPSRGMSGEYQQVGMLYKDTVDSETKTIGSGNETTLLALYGRPTYPGSNRWSYYTSSDKYHQIKIPFSNNGKECNSQHGCAELYDGDQITLPAYNGVFKVNIYDYNTPRYIPYVW